MAQDYRLVVDKLDGTKAISIWHDDNMIESIEMPIVESLDIKNARLKLWQTMVDFCRRNQVDHLHCKKII